MDKQSLRIFAQKPNRVAKEKVKGNVRMGQLVALCLSPPVTPPLSLLSYFQAPKFGVRQASLNYWCN